MPVKTFPVTRWPRTGTKKHPERSDRGFFVVVLPKVSAVKARHVNPQHPTQQLSASHPLSWPHTAGRRGPGGVAPRRGPAAGSRGGPGAQAPRCRGAPPAREGELASRRRPAGPQLQAPFPRRSSARRLPPLLHLPGEGSDGAAQPAAGLPAGWERRGWGEPGPLPGGPDRQPGGRLPPAPAGFAPREAGHGRDRRCNRRFQPAGGSGCGYSKRSGAAARPARAAPRTTRHGTALTAGEGRGVAAVEIPQPHRVCGSLFDFFVCLFVFLAPARGQYVRAGGG